MAVTARVLAIHSHVSFGYVGGKAAVFPLQCMGYDVDVVNTVHFSNHTGYGAVGGTKTSADDLARILDSMDKIGALAPARIVTGYIPNAESLAVVHGLIKKLRAANPDLVYVLDPVLGDAGRFYVSKDCVSTYRQMLSLGTIITPNWFEVEILTEIPLTDLASLRAALRKLHTTYHVPHVVISSIPLSKLSASLQSYLCPDEATRDYLVCIASSANEAKNGHVSTVYAGCVEWIPGYFTGTGDLFSSLVLGHFDASLCDAVSHALSRTHSVLRLTHEAALALALPATDDELDELEPARRAKRMKGRELRIVQGQEIFRRKEWEGVTRMRALDGFWLVDLM